jgi:small subunit ribosomal protein S18
VTKYETTFILDPGLDETRVNEEVEKVTQWIKGLGGEVLEVQRWGKRRLAYEINRRRDGIYTLMLYQGPGPIVKELERRFRLNESVLRNLTVLHVPPELTQPQVDAEAVAAAEEADEACRARTGRAGRRLGHERDVRNEGRMIASVPNEDLRWQRTGRFKKKYCKLCFEKVGFVDYKDEKRLGRFVTDRGKIVPRRVSGTCARHQKQLTTAIKRARVLALLPFTSDFYR